MGNSQSNNRVLPAPNYYEQREMHPSVSPISSKARSMFKSKPTKPHHRIDAIYFQFTIQEAIKHLMIGAIRTVIERTGVYNADSSSYPGVTGRVSFDWLRGQPLFDLGEVGFNYEVLDYDREREMSGGSDDDTFSRYSVLPVTFVMSTALLDRKDYHVDVSNNHLTGQIYGAYTYGPRHVHEIDEESFGDETQVASITFHHAVPTDYIQEIWLHSSIADEDFDDMRYYKHQQAKLKESFLKALKMIQGLSERFASKVVIDRLTYPNERFTYTPENHQELMRMAHGFAPNFCFAGTARSLHSRLNLNDMKKMAIDCGFSYEDVVDIQDTERLSELIAKRANQLFSGETEDGEPTEVGVQVYDPPFRSADEPFTQEFVVSMLAHKMFQHHVNNRVPLLVSRREIQKLLDNSTKEIDLIGVLRNTLEDSVGHTLRRARSL
jgi:hypothetical protein